jgi:hypothetical protein
VIAQRCQVDDEHAIADHDPEHWQATLDTAQHTRPRHLHLAAEHDLALDRQSGRTGSSAPVRFIVRFRTTPTLPNEVV